MKYGLAQAVFWIVAFIIIALLPSAMALIGPQPLAREFWVEFGVLLGFLGLAVLSLQCVITGRLQWFATGFGFDSLLVSHKHMGIFALLLVLAHPTILFMANPTFMEYLDPRVNFLRAIALFFVIIASILLVASSLLRLTFRLSYEQWRVAHGVLSFGILFFGLGHVLMVDHCTEPLWEKAAFVVICGSALYLIIHSRFVRPLLMRRRPYRIVEVHPQRNDSWTLIIEPEGHPGLKFRAGQFLWITIGDTPFSLQQHPFSIASSSFNEQIELTIKELGDFTKSVKGISLGIRVWLEGPYGCFYHEPQVVKGAIFITGGVGITPIMSLLRDACDRADDSPCVLFDGNTAWDDVMFREEIGEMASRIRLKVIHVLTDPPEDWSGEVGYIDQMLLERYLPKDYEKYAYFNCGPPALAGFSRANPAETGRPGSPD